MLPGKGNAVAIYASSTNKEMTMAMETSKCVLKLVKCRSRNGIATRDIAEFKKCREAFDYLRRYMTGNCTKIYLVVQKYISCDSLSYGVELTFISAFESSPVHCEKSRPSGKRRKPGNAGIAEILTKAWLVHVCHRNESRVLVVNIRNNFKSTSLTVCF
jgi:hypothetical protein